MDWGRPRGVHEVGIEISDPLNPIDERDEAKLGMASEQEEDLQGDW